ncbi:MAG: hypothetical protein R2684_01430 [Pyrinomonadaceae bacterium]
MAERKVDVKMMICVAIGVFAGLMVFNFGLKMDGIIGGALGGGIGAAAGMVANSLLFKRAQ